MKTCKKCNTQKPLDRFGTFKNRQGGHSHRGTCLDCRAIYHQEHADELVAYRRDYNAGKRSAKQQRDRERKDEAKAFVDTLKSAPCLDCGRSFPPVCMDFDHRPGTPKVMGVASMVGSGYKLDLIKVEIDKCDLVCACCHRIRTHQRGENLARP